MGWLRNCCRQIASPSAPRPTTSDIPASLKSYIGHIVRKGLSQALTGEGRVHDKTCTVLMASGGVYTEGSPIRDRDIAMTYLTLILNVMGIEELTFVTAGGATVVDLGVVPRAEFLERFRPAITAAAQA